VIGHDALVGLSELADTHGCHVLIDEVYLEFLYPDGVRTGATISPWFITTRSLTKAYGLGSLRVGWIIAKPTIAERIRRLHDLFMAEVSHPAERLAAIALDRADELLAPAVATLSAHIERVDAFVTEHKSLSWVRPHAGTVGFVHLSGGRVDEMVERLAASYDTLVTPGRFFGAEDHFRVGWGVDGTILDEGLRRLADTIDKL
jgi:aspartate/methionine/tyrosine aminotransferase